jgi:hypothetical protein
MKKLTLAAATLLVALSGCNTCSNLTQRITGHFGKGLGNCRLNGAQDVGAPCDAGCEGPESAAPCSTCGQSAGYGSYDGMVVGGSDGIVTGTYDGIPSGATISTVPSTTLPSGTYLTNPGSSSIRGESVTPRPAN